MIKYFTLFALLCAANTRAQISFTPRIVKDSLFVPWEIIYGPDDHIWFTQRNGYLCRMDPLSGQTDTIYHEANTVNQGGEGGLLGMALHPQFAAQPYLYAAYDYLLNGIYTARVVRYTYANGVLQTPQILLDSVTANFNHNGCRLLIVGDKLFISFGDAQNQAAPQDVQSPNGKILRLNLDGSIPADNPVPDNPVWTWGHRNVQGLVFANGMLYSSEHGNTTDDEINIIYKGCDYGWPNVEGFCDQPAEQAFCADSNVVAPLFAWTPTVAPSGIDYYAQPMFPALQDHLLLATLKDQHLYYLTLNATRDSVTAATILAGFDYGRLRDICISPAGKIYVSTSNSLVNGMPVDRIIELSDSGTEIPVAPAATAISICPNPAADYIKIVQKSNEGTAWRLFDYSGHQLRSGIMERLTTVSLQGLAAGSYLLQVTGKNRAIWQQKVIKE